MLRHSGICDPMNCSSPDSSVHGIFQARILEWVTISFIREEQRGTGRKARSLNPGLAWPRALRPAPEAVRSAVLHRLLQCR